VGRHRPNYLPFVAFYKHDVLVCIFYAFDNIRVSSCLLTKSVDNNVYVIHVLQVIRQFGVLKCCITQTVTQLFYDCKVFFNSQVTPVTIVIRLDHCGI
jgi:hypothetical protein